MIMFNLKECVFLNSDITGLDWRHVPQVFDPWPIPSYFPFHFQRLKSVVTSAQKIIKDFKVIVDPVMSQTYTCKN